MLEAERYITTVPLLFNYTSITIQELLLNPSKLKLYLKNQSWSSVLRKYANLHICLHKNGFQICFATKPLRFNLNTCASVNAATFPLRMGSLSSYMSVQSNIMHRSFLAGSILDFTCLKVKYDKMCLQLIQRKINLLIATLFYSIILQYLTIFKCVS